MNLKQSTELIARHGKLPEPKLFQRGVSKSVGSIGSLTTDADQLAIILNQQLLKPFLEREVYQVVLVFVDVVDFSKDTLGDSSREIARKLDDYYSIVVPSLYRHNGVIEKIIGDGIIGIFGQPFLDKDLGDLIRGARDFGKEVLAQLRDSGIPAKMALHNGEVMFYSPQQSEYRDYTIVGEPLTELFRLESVAEPNAICVYEDSGYVEYISVGKSGGDGMYRGKAKPEQLQGLGQRNIIHVYI